MSSWGKVKQDINFNLIINFFFLRNKCHYKLKTKNKIKKKKKKSLLDAQIILPTKGKKKSPLLKVIRGLRQITNTKIKKIIIL